MSKPLGYTHPLQLIHKWVAYLVHSFGHFSLFHPVSFSPVSICQEDLLSGERWHCTAESCEPSCPYNGARYSVGVQLDLQGNSWSVNVSDCEDAVSHRAFYFTNSVCAVNDEKTLWECALSQMP